MTPSKYLPKNNGSKPQMTANESRRFKRRRQKFVAVINSTRRQHEKYPKNFTGFDNLIKRG